MIKFLKIAFLFFFATVLHWWFMGFSSLGFRTNIMFVFMFLSCVFFNPAKGYTAAFFSGLFLDFFGVTMFGVNALTFTVCACVIYFLKDKMDFESYAAQLLTVFLLNIFSVLFYSIVGLFFLKGVVWYGVISMILGAFINALLTPLFFQLFKFLKIGDAAR